MGAAEQRKLAAIMFTDMVGDRARAQGNDRLAQEHRDGSESAGPILP